MENLHLDKYKAVAVLAVDVQNDFCPGGALAVENGDQVINPLNTALASVRRLKQHRLRSGNHIPNGIEIASRDWHPTNTDHFSDTPNFVNSWPEHCVAWSWGANLHPNLGFDPMDAIIVNKGQRPDEDGYSAFSGTRNLTESRLLDILDPYIYPREQTALFIGGLATDYCVRATVLDAYNNGFATFLLTDAIRGVSIDTTTEALDDMRAAINSDHFVTTTTLNDAIDRLVAK